MKRNASICYAITMLLCLLTGILLVGYFAFQTTYAFIFAITGLLLSFVLAPTLHELGHIFFAKKANMRIVYAKFFCFKLQINSGKLRLSFASPFATEQTQVLPKSSENIQHRAKLYTLGGLFFGVALLLFTVAMIAVLSLFGDIAYLAWGALPYTAYLFMLNTVPAEYVGGKTDMLVYIGLKRGEAVETNMLTAMQIQGKLYEGYSFAEMDETLFTDTPQLCEDEPLFAVMLDLKYRYYLEKNELEKAADCLNRLVLSQDYLSLEERERVAAECVYMHAVTGDYERAEECGKYCKDFLAGENVTAKRILAAYSSAFGKTDAVEPLKAQAEKLLLKEYIKGVEKFERILLSRIV